MGTLGIMGGTYDPPHYGHLAAAEEARWRLNLDRVLWLPVGDPPHKRSRSVTPAHHRLAMVQAAVANNEGFEVSDLELRRRGPSYTADTLQELGSEYERDALVFLMGSDEFLSLSTWHRPERIPQLARIAVLVRAGLTPEVATVEREVPAVTGRYTLVPVPNLPLSSSGLRERVRCGLPIRYLVPEAVRSYIDRHGLYKG